MIDKRLTSRRQVLTRGASAIGLAWTGDTAFAQGVVAPGAVAPLALAPTPACHDGDVPTRPEIEGPFFKPASPLRANLREQGIMGQPIELAGFVVTRSCRPIAMALIELWQANDQGEYDTKGYRLRGHLFTDQKGHFAFRTIVPGLYPGRTRHFHIKVQAAAESPVLTTQLYFPNEPRNLDDEYFHPELVMQMATAPDGQRARFDVILAAR